MTHLFGNVDQGLGGQLGQHLQRGDDELLRGEAGQQADTQLTHLARGRAGQVNWTADGHAEHAPEKWQAKLDHGAGRNVQDEITKG